MARFVVEVKEWKPLDVKEADVLALTEAARLLGLSPSAVSDLQKSGALRRVWDMDEPNDRKRGRVLRADLVREQQRRRERHDDGRLKRKRGRPFGDGS